MKAVEGGSRSVVLECVRMLAHTCRPGGGDRASKWKSLIALVVVVRAVLLVVLEAQASGAVVPAAAHSTS
jgi:hypothetical protein